MSVNSFASATHMPQAARTAVGSARARPDLRFGINRHFLAGYDDVVYRVHPSAMIVVTRSAAALKTGAERVMSRC